MRLLLVYHATGHYVYCLYCTPCKLSDLHCPPLFPLYDTDTLPGKAGIMCEALRGPASAIKACLYLMGGDEAGAVSASKANEDTRAKYFSGAPAVGTVVVWKKDKVFLKKTLPAAYDPHAAADSATPLTAEEEKQQYEQLKQNLEWYGLTLQQWSKPGHARYNVVRNEVHNTADRVCGARVQAAVAAAAIEADAAAVAAAEEVDGSLEPDATSNGG